MAGIFSALRTLACPRNIAQLSKNEYLGKRRKCCCCPRRRHCLCLSWLRREWIQLLPVFQNPDEEGSSVRVLRPLQGWRRNGGCGSSGDTTSDYKEISPALQKEMREREVEVSISEIEGKRSSRKRMAEQRGQRGRRAPLRHRALTSPSLNKRTKASARSSFAWTRRCRPLELIAESNATRKHFGGGRNEGHECKLGYSHSLTNSLAEEYNCTFCPLAFKVTEFTFYRIYETLISCEIVLAFVLSS